MTNEALKRFIPFPPRGLNTGPLMRCSISPTYFPLYGPCYFFSALYAVCGSETPMGANQLMGKSQHIKSAQLTLMDA